MGDRGVVDGEIFEGNRIVAARVGRTQKKVYVSVGAESTKNVRIQDRGVVS
jgi:hypothetical protein